MGQDPPYENLQRAGETGVGWALAHRSEGKTDELRGIRGQAVAGGRGGRDPAPARSLSAWTRRQGLPRGIGPCVVKAQVPTGKRGKAGGIQLAADADAARTHAANILGMDIGGFTVDKLLIEGQVPIQRELYAAILNDPITCGPGCPVLAHGRDGCRGSGRAGPQCHAAPSGQHHRRIEP